MAQAGSVLRPRREPSRIETRRRLTLRSVTPEFISFDRIESTSLHARREVVAGRAPRKTVAYVAASQTGGIGRLGRRWRSPEGGLWMTLVLSVPGPPPSILGPSVGAAVCQACEAVLAASRCETPLRLKWPNDVMLRDRKVGGILCETIRGPDGGAELRLLVGLGVNANFDPSQLPEELRPRATTLREELGADIDLAALRSTTAGAIVRAVDATYAGDATLLNDARARLWGVDREVSISRPDGSRVTGRVHALTEDGSLMAAVNGRPEIFSSAELWPAE